MPEDSIHGTPDWESKKSAPPRQKKSAPPKAAPEQPAQNSPSGPRILVNAAPGGIRRGSGMLSKGAVGAYNASQGENFYNEQGTNYRYHTLYALSIAFLIVFATQIYVRTASGGTATEATGNRVKDSLDGAAGAASLKAWAVIALVLMSMSGFKSTQSLAAAFSWLILISVVLINGQQLLKIFNGPIPVGKSTTPPISGSNINPKPL